MPVFLLLSPFLAFLLLPPFRCPLAARWLGYGVFLCGLLIPGSSGSQRPFLPCHPPTHPSDLQRGAADDRFFPRARAVLRDSHARWCPSRRRGTPPPPHAQPPPSEARWLPTTLPGSRADAHRCAVLFWVHNAAHPAAKSLAGRAPPPPPRSRSAAYGDRHAFLLLLLWFTLPHRYCPGFLSSAGSDPPPPHSAAALSCRCLCFC